MKYLKILYRLLVVTLLVYCFFPEDIKKKSSEKNKALKMTSQLVIFRAFFLFFFRPLDPKTDFFLPVNQLP